MIENGTEKPNSILRDVTDQISEHIDLAALELGYETQQAAKRLSAAAVAGILVLTGFIVLQVSIVGLLMKAGLSLGVAALLLSVLYFAVAFAVFWKFGRRDKRVGPPFLATQHEIQRTIQWIQKILS